MKYLFNNFWFTTWSLYLAGLANANHQPLFRVRVEVQHDDYPTDTGWSFYNTGTGEIFLYQAEGSVTQQDERVVLEVWVNPGNYRFDITDSWGDGSCCSHGYGYYRVIVNGVPLYGDGDYGSGDSKTFTIAGNGSVGNVVVPEPEVTYQLEVLYPTEGWDETKIKIERDHDNENMVVFDYGEGAPGQYKTEEADLVPGVDYKLKLIDQEFDGMIGGYALVAMYIDGILVEYVAFINGDEFTRKGKEIFQVPQASTRSSLVQSAQSRAGSDTGSADSCEDTTETFILRGEEHTCDWIEQYWPQSRSFCDLDTVEQACRKTCRMCGDEDNDDDEV